MAEKWEYLTEFLTADAKNQEAQAYIRSNWPNWKNPPKFAVESLGPELNKRGEDGWELVQMHPVYVGSNHDVMMGRGDAPVTNWTHVYLCAFKRRKA